MMARVPAIYRPLVAIQLSNEMAQVAVSRQKSAEEKREAETKRADSAERQLQYVEKYRKKLEAKKEKRIRKQRRDKSKSKK
jgi:hypothetical protein